MKPDLDALFAAARTSAPDTSRVEFGFETRLLARLRTERSESWLVWGWKLCPICRARARGQCVGLYPGRFRARSGERRRRREDRGTAGARLLFQLCRMKRLKSILTVLLIFASGLIVGGILAATATLHDVVNRTFRDGPVKIRTVLLQRAKQDLRLDEDQAHQFWQILSDTGVELKQAAEPVRPEIEAALARSNARLRAVLRSDQQPDFDRFMERAATRWREVLDGTPAAGQPAKKPSSPDGSDSSSGDPGVVLPNTPVPEIAPKLETAPPPPPADPPAQ